MEGVGFYTASTVRILEDELFSSSPNKYTGCNCTKSKCLKMYCACFSVGKMCDQVKEFIFRRVSANPAPMIAIIWGDHKLLIKSSLKIHMHSLGKILTSSLQNQYVIAKNHFVWKSIVIAIGVGKIVELPANAKDAIIKKQSRKRKDNNRPNRSNSIDSFFTTCILPTIVEICNSSKYLFNCCAATVDSVLYILN